MRYLRYLFLAALAVCLITIAIANSAPVTLRVLPEGLEGFAGFTWSTELPLYVIVFLGVIFGLLIGFVWEWLREHKHRAEAARRRKEVQQLEGELRKVRRDETKGGDEILALLEESR